jgi:hypothetical protein
MVHRLAKFNGSKLGVGWEKIPTDSKQAQALTLKYSYKMYKKRMKAEGI